MDETPLPTGSPQGRAESMSPSKHFVSHLAFRYVGLGLVDVVRSCVPCPGLNRATPCQVKQTRMCGEEKD